MKRASVILLALVALAGFPLQAKAGPILGGSENFAVLGNSTVTNTGATTIGGDIGLYPGTSYTGSGTVTHTSGVDHITDAVALAAQADNVTAYNALAGLLGATDLSGQDLGGMTLTPGIYKFTSSAFLTGTISLKLDAGLDDNPFWVFQIGSTLITGPGSSVEIINAGADGSTAGGLFWQVGSSATLDTTTDFEGSILALASIALNTGAKIHNGRAWAQTGAVTMDANTIDINSPPFTAFLTGGIEFNDQGQVVAVDNPNQPLAAVPEPGSFVIFGSLLAGLLVFRKRFLSAA